MKRVCVLVMTSAVVVAIWALTWSRFTNTDHNTAVNKYLSLAEKQSAEGAYGSAIKCYQRVIELEDKVEYRLSLAKTYALYGDQNLYVEVLSDTVRIYPKTKKAYEQLADYHYSVLDYEECLNIISQAEQAGIKSELLIELNNLCAYRYSVGRETYNGAGIFCNGFAIVQKNGKVFYINERMDPIGETRYDAGDLFLGNTAAVTKDGESFFIDQRGKKYLVPQSDYRKMFSFSQGRAAVILQNQNQYGYINSLGERVLATYEYAGTYLGGIAAVKQAQGWQLIDLQGKAMTDNYYEDIRLDDKNSTGSNEVFFVKTNRYYIMIDQTGKPIGKERFEDARPFAGESLAAIKKEGQWGFTDINGKIVITACYEDARSFSEGLAAVKKNGTWGFINKKNEMVIKNAFQDAKSFSENGKAPVKIGDLWSYITIYQ